MSRTPDEIHDEISNVHAATMGADCDISAPGGRERLAELHGRLADLWDELRRADGMPLWAYAASGYAMDTHRDHARFWRESTERSGERAAEKVVDDPDDAAGHCAVCVRGCLPGPCPAAQADGSGS